MEYRPNLSKLKLEVEAEEAPGPSITEEGATRLLEALERHWAKEAIRRAQAKRRAEAELIWSGPD